MKLAVKMPSIVILLLLWGIIGPCWAADPLPNLPSTPQVLTPPATNTPSLPTPLETPLQTPAQQSPSPITAPLQMPLEPHSLTDRFTSILNSPNIIRLWTENSLTAWIILLLSIFVGMVVGKICSILLQRVGTRAWATAGKLLVDLAGPANLALLTLGLHVGLLPIQMSPDLQWFVTKVLQFLYSIAVFWYVFNLASLVDVLFQRLSRKTNSSLDKLIAPLVRRSLRVFLVVIAVLFVFQSIFEKDIGAWLAGLGLAGLAVTLAAQDSLKNLFGSITVILDQSFKIGDRIICTGCDGIIEDIGFRSTKVRTLGGHLVTIPNANIVNSPIENVSRRPAIRRNFTLALSLDTSAEKVKQALQLIKTVLAERELYEHIHPKIQGETVEPRVVFSDYTPKTLNLDITYWYAPPNTGEYMAHAEKLNMRILEELNRAGIKLVNY